MIGTFKIEHIRDGKVIQSFECENKIVTEGKQELVEIRHMEGSQSFVVNPSSGEFELVMKGKNPFGRLLSASVATFPEPIDLTGDDELEITFDPLRASGDTICDACGKLYFDHPYTADRDHCDRPFLKQLCNGQVVKL